VARTARKQILKRTRGHYPAPLAAVRAVVNGSRRRLADGLEREAALVGDLIAGDISKNLMAIFGDSEGARHLRVPTDAGGEWPRGGSVGVLGAGVMGAGIAHLLLDRRHFVRLRDLSAEALQKGLEHIGSLLNKQVKRRRKTPLQRDEITSRLTHTTGVEGFGRTDALIEAIVEILAVKRKALAEIEPHIGPETLFLSNTSALSITALQEGARHPERVVGLHFFNPVHRMPLVEVIPGEGTASWAVAKTVALAQALGKLPVVVKDSPGFLVNRLLLPYLGAACRLLEEGIPGPVIDRAALDFGLPMGPLRLLDEVGIDIAAEVGGTLHQAFGDRARPSPLLQRMADKEWLGQKSGIGFYRHEGQASGSATLPWNEGVETGSSPGGGRLPGDAEIVFALLDPMIDEAARCLEEGVVTGAGQVDLAMVMGTGFPAFRGGLLRHADRIGLGGIVERLERHARDGRGAAPCELLRRLARDGARFHGTTKNPAATESPERHPSRV
ncbi:MAG: 3-hydroxyacyl-CoA dehydrogenase NAD-binding domain-containing protein, partial [Planctomycetota bacterium]